MKALLAIAHYFRPDADGKYSSTREGQRERRAEALRSVLAAWRAHCGETATIDIGTKTMRTAPGTLERLDIAVMVQGDNHLLTPELKKRYQVIQANAKVQNARMLPFGAHMLLAGAVGKYDWLLYAEDDLALHDPFLFPKVTDFQARFGASRVLQPNRYEVNARGTRFKTYIDGDLRPESAERLFALVPESEATLAIESTGMPVVFERARNPHSGFFALTSDQFAHWKRQKHFMDADPSFVSPLESAATLGLVKTFSLYKARAPHQGYFEIQHLDDKFSNNPFPLADNGSS